MPKVMICNKDVEVTVEVLKKGNNHKVTMIIMIFGWYLFNQMVWFQWRSNFFITTAVFLMKFCFCLVISGTSLSWEGFIWAVRNLMGDVRD